MSGPAWRAVPGGLELLLKVIPGARRPGLGGFEETAQGTALKLKVAAPPEDGRANAAIINWLADALAVPKRAITIRQGERDRAKRLLIVGDASDLAARLASLASPEQPLAGHRAGGRQAQSPPNEQAS